MTKKRVLIVDDEVSFTRLLALNLERSGHYDVRAESEGKQALAAARDFHPDVILLDVLMPDIPGGEVAAQFQADAQLRDIPIIFLTAVVSRQDVQEHGGVISGYPYVAKPTSIDELIACIEQHLPPSDAIEPADLDPLDRKIFRRHQFRFQSAAHADKQYTMATCAQFARHRQRRKDVASAPAAGHDKTVGHLHPSCSLTLSSIPSDVSVLNSELPPKLIMGSGKPFSLP